MKKVYKNFIEELLRENNFGSLKIMKTGLPSVADQKKVLKSKETELSVSDYKIAEIIAKKLRPNDKSLYVSIKTSFDRLHRTNQPLTHNVFKILWDLSKQDVKILHESVPESDIVPDELEHMKILVSAMEQHLADINKYKVVLNNSSIDEKVKTIETELDGIKKEILSLVSESKLSYSQKQDLPDSSFVFPKTRKYPIPDEAHARNALSRVSQNGSSSEIAAVKAAVKKKFPSIEVS